MLIPELTDQQLREITSRAEAKLYKALLQGLPSDYLALFQVGWIASKNSGGAEDGEIDFLIYDPRRGFLALEVKGGGIAFDPVRNEWTSVNRQSQVFPIKDPVRQALNAKHQILRKLKAEEKTIESSFNNVVVGHAVFFPDISFSSTLVRSDCPAEIIGTAENLADIRTWVDAAFNFWTRDGFSKPGVRGFDVIRKVLAKTIAVESLRSTRISSVEDEILTLTNDQLKLLSFIAARRRVLILGGAGTGKTVLAVEKARQLARSGFQTLITCYNRPLTEFLTEVVAEEENITVLSIHQLAKRYIDAAKNVTGRDLLLEMKHSYPEQSFSEANIWNVLMPLAMWEAAEFVNTRFDAIVCDEGQDVPEDFWMPLQRLLSDFSESPFYIFKDDNQDIYGRESSNIFEEAPFHLSTNCRNTREIHTLAYSHYEGPSVYAPIDSGIPVIFLKSNNLEGQADLILREIRKLILDPGLKASEIVVLLSSESRGKEMKVLLGQLAISKAVSWTVNHRRSSSEVLVETVKRFKGLESPIVFLWIDDTQSAVVKREEIYVGASRARTQLVIVSTGASS